MLPYSNVTSQFKMIIYLSYTWNKVHIPIYSKYKTHVRPEFLTMLLKIQVFWDE